MLSAMARIHVSIDDRLLIRLDRAAAEAGLTRGTYLAALVTRELETASRPGADPRVRRALARLDRLFEGQVMKEDPAVAIRAERDARDRSVTDVLAEAGLRQGGATVRDIVAAIRSGRDES